MNMHIYRSGKKLIAVLLIALVAVSLMGCGGKAAAATPPPAPTAAPTPEPTPEPTPQPEPSTDPVSQDVPDAA